MAVGTGAGPLNVTKPISVNDMMEAIQIPGLQPPSGCDPTTGIMWDVGGGSITAREVCSLGSAGYTQVVDDIIIEVGEVIANGTGIDFDFGILDEADAAVTNNDDYFLVSGSAKSRILTADTGAGGANVRGALISVLRGNLPNSVTWAATAATETLRTFGPLAVDADGVAVAARQKPLSLTAKLTHVGSTPDAGKFRIYVRSHYTAVNFGAGL